MGNVQAFPRRFTGALERVRGDIGLLREMAAITSTDLSAVKRQADQVVATGDCRDSAPILHKLRGMLSTFETDGVALELEDVLAMARARRADEMQKAYEQIRQRIDELVDDIVLLSALPDC